MDLDAIAVFVKVVEAGSFSGAARLLKMPKTTVSAKVAALEKRLAVILIQRTTRKLYLTEAGSQYFHHCVNAVREIELGEAALMASRSTPTGLLKLTAPTDLGHTLLPKIIHAYLKKYPQVSVEMVLSNGISDLVGEGIDLAIRAGRLKDSSLIAKPFMPIAIHLWATPAYLAQTRAPNHPRELEQHQVLGLSAMRTTVLSKGKATVDVVLRSRVLTDDFEAVKAMVMVGEGIGWLPDFLVADAHAAGVLVPVLADWKHADAGGFNFLYPGKKYASPKVQAFIATALDMVAQD
jgi:DNA-binding transcriptional LysR family regulator